MMESLDLFVPTALRQAKNKLAAAGVASPEHDARELAEQVLGRQLALAPRQFTPQQAAEFARLVDLRAARVPLQHLLGKMWFRYLELKSAPGVFIVRPETELVAEAAISEVRRLQAAGETNPLVLDLCTGSGAIALALASETNNHNVHAVEISSQAYALAVENSACINLEIDLRLGDALSEFSEFAGKVAVIVANPPYVPPNHQLAPEVAADPALALFGGGRDGLDFPRKLIHRAAQLLRADGLLVMEHADEQGAATSEIACSAGFYDAHTCLDLAGKPRYLQARKI